MANFSNKAINKIRDTVKTVQNWPTPLAIVRRRNNLPEESWFWATIQNPTMPNANGAKYPFVSCRILDSTPADEITTQTWSAYDSASHPNHIEDDAWNLDELLGEDPGYAYDESLVRIHIAFDTAGEKFYYFSSFAIEPTQVSGYGKPAAGQVDVPITADIILDLTDAGGTPIGGQVTVWKNATHSTLYLDFTPSTVFKFVYSHDGDGDPLDGCVYSRTEAFATDGLYLPSDGYDLLDAANVAPVSTDATGSYGNANHIHVKGEMYMRDLGGGGRGWAPWFAIDPAILDDKFVGISTGKTPGYLQDVLNFPDLWLTETVNVDALDITHSDPQALADTIDAFVNTTSQSTQTFHMVATPNDFQFDAKGHFIDKAADTGNRLEVDFRADEKWIGLVITPGSPEDLLWEHIGPDIATKTITVEGDSWIGVTYPTINFDAKGHNTDASKTLGLSLTTTTLDVITSYQVDASTKKLQYKTTNITVLAKGTESAWITAHTGAECS